MAKINSEKKEVIENIQSIELELKTMTKKSKEYLNNNEEMCEVDLDTFKKYKEKIPKLIEAVN